jgi:hypothetical protein
MIMKILKKTVWLAICSTALLVAGCGEKENGRTVIKNPVELCVNGVVYYTFGHGKAPAYGVDGNIVLCGN